MEIPVSKPVLHPISRGLLPRSFCFDLRDTLRSVTSKVSVLSFASLWNVGQKPACIPHELSKTFHLMYWSEKPRHFCYVPGAVRALKVGA